ncbi:toxin-antitoxin system YwqK family antitoxin, partial [Pyxidicoccus fallax]|uniref:toxin-antitoxin system YwqK family antitoxin n=1 Tax=Pyxidicoccus fallax TaxID=394095 RepID=UPI001B7D6502
VYKRLLPEKQRLPSQALFLMGTGALPLAGIVLVMQAALPERFPSLLELALLAPVLTGAPSDFFPLSAWMLALLPWGLVALVLGMGHELARRARASLDWGALEGIALTLVPGVHLVGGPRVLGELGRVAESQDSGLDLRLKTKSVVAVVLHVAAVALAVVAFRGAENPSLFLAASVAKALSVAAFAVVLAGLGQALLALKRAGEAPGAAHTRMRTAARVGGVEHPRMAGVWAGALGVTGVLLVGGGFARSEAWACGEGTRTRRTVGENGSRTSACVLPDGRRQGPEQVRTPDGRLLASGEYQEGQPHGTFRTWSEAGVPWEERAYARGQPHGTWKLYGQDGRLAMEEAYVDGKREGASTTFHANGNPRSRKHYQKGAAHGRHATWFASGLVEVEGAFNQGRPSGWWVRRDVEGKLVKQWSEGGGGTAETAGVAAVFVGGSSLASSLPQGATEAEEVRGGHTRQWWQERLALLRSKSEKDPKVAALYQLTLERARANGFGVAEKPEGVELSLQPAP